TVPDILFDVLTGFSVTGIGLSGFLPRDYCVQYRETDFNFLSRLMEEEGIFYFFEHSADDHRLFLSDTPEAHRTFNHGQFLYQSVLPGRSPEFGTIFNWEKVQELRSGRYTLRDQTFELTATRPENPGTFQDLQAAVKVNGKVVQVGQVAHPLQVGGNDQLEL